MPTIRHAKKEDLEAITEIYNEAIINTTATFDTEEKSLEDRRAWFENHDSRHPILVAEEGEQVVGWASLSKWSDRGAYSDTAEISLYVREEYQGRGIGRGLLEAILEEGKKAGLHTLIARVAEDNEASIHLLESTGFEHVGKMREVGRKFGELLDINLLQKIYCD